MDSYGAKGGLPAYLALYASRLAMTRSSQIDGCGLYANTLVKSTYPSDCPMVPHPHASGRYHVQYFARPTSSPNNTAMSENRCCSDTCAVVPTE